MVVRIGSGTQFRPLLPPLSWSIPSSDGSQPTEIVYSFLCRRRRSPPASRFWGLSEVTKRRGSHTHTHQAQWWCVRRVRGPLERSPRISCWWVSQSMARMRWVWMWLQVLQAAPSCRTAYPCLTVADVLVSLYTWVIPAHTTCRCIPLHPDGIGACVCLPVT